MPTTTLITSLVTPFRSEPTREGLIETSVSEHHLAFEVQRQVRAGIKAVAVAGWMGEGPTLTRDERISVVMTASEVAAGRMRVLAHVGTSDTAKSMALASDAALAGADGLIIVTPPYNKPNAAGLKTHIESIARSTSLPIHLEFDPSRTNVRVSVPDMASLADIPGVAGIIDHSPNPRRVESLGDRPKPVEFVTGYEPSSVTASIFGADGFLSALANFAPDHVREIQKACALQHFDRARQLYKCLLPLMLAIEDDGVAALKYAMRLRFQMDPVVRLPLVPLSRLGRHRVEAAIQAIGDVPPHLATRCVAEDVQ